MSADNNQEQEDKPMIAEDQEKNSEPGGDAEPRRREGSLSPAQQPCYAESECQRCLPGGPSGLVCHRLMQRGYVHCGTEGFVVCQFCLRRWRCNFCDHNAAVARSVALQTCRHNTCRMVLSSAAEERRHASDTHAPKALYRCKRCASQFDESEALRAHYAQNHPNVQEDAVEEEEMAADDAAASESGSEANALVMLPGEYLICHLCWAAASSEREMRLHLTRHYQASGELLRGGDPAAAAAADSRDDPHFHLGSEHSVDSHANDDNLANNGESLPAAASDGMNLESGEIGRLDANDDAQASLDSESPKPESPVVIIADDSAIDDDQPVETNFQVTEAFHPGESYLKKLFRLAPEAKFRRSLVATISRRVMTHGGPPGPGTVLSAGYAAQDLHLRICAEVSAKLGAAPERTEQRVRKVVESVLHRHEFVMSLWRCYQSKLKSAKKVPIEPNGNTGAASKPSSSAAPDGDENAIEGRVFMEAAGDRVGQLDDIEAEGVSPDDSDRHFISDGAESPSSDRTEPGSSPRATQFGRRGN